MLFYQLLVPCPASSRKQTGCTELVHIFGNKMAQMRPVTCDFGQLSRPDGTVNFTQGDTTVMAAVYGPGEVRVTKEILDKATVEVIFKQKSGLPGCGEKCHEQIIRNTCELAILASLHPRSAVNIVVQEVQNSGSFLACAINAACLALLDASVSMKYQIAAVCVAINLDGEIIVDPDSNEEKCTTAVLTFAFDSRDNNIITVSTKGSYSNQQFQTCSAMAKLASKQIFQFYRSAVEKKLSKHV